MLYLNTNVGATLEPKRGGAPDLSGFRAFPQG